MTPEQLREKYARLATEGRQLGTTAPLAKVAEMVLSDLDGLTDYGVTPASPEPAPLLTATQVAARLGVDTTWVYRHARKWPSARKLSGKALRFDAQQLERDLANQEEK